MMPAIQGNLSPKSLMKARIKKPFLLPALIVGLGLMLAGQVTAQTFTTLHSFTATPPILDLIPTATELIRMPV
jgi:hypothetical protein